MDKKDKKQIVKPLGLVRKEMQENIVKAINESGLPLSIVSYILKDMLNEINIAVAQQESAEISQYEAELATLKEE